MSPISRKRMFFAQIAVALGSSLLSGLVLSACEVQKAEAQRDLISVPALQNFVIQKNQLSESVTLFLWRLNPLTGDDEKNRVETASNIADRINDLDKERKSLDKLKEKIDAECGDSEECSPGLEQVYEVMGQVDEMNSGLRKIRAQIRVPNRVPPLQRVPVATLNQAMLNAQRRKEKKILELVNGPFKGVANLDLIIATHVRLSELDSEALELPDELAEIVDYWQKPGNFVIKPRGDLPPSVKIGKWVPDYRDTSEEHGRTYSTEDGSIQAVQYDVHGGRFRFDVPVVENGVFSVYSFDLARAKYADTLVDRKAYYSGKVEKRDINGTITRRGVIKITATGGV